MESRLRESRVAPAMIDAVFAIPGDITLPTGGYGYDRRVLAGLAAEGVRARHLVLPGTFPRPSAADLAETERLLSAVPSGTPLLVDGLALGVIPPDLIDRVGRPLVALVHHPLGLEAGLSAAEAGTLKSSERAVLTRAQHVIVTSPMTGKILAQDFRVTAARITVAEPGTDPAARSHAVGQPSTLLAVGSIIPRKGYDVLVNALARLGHDDWHLTIAGADDRAPDTAEALRAQITNSKFAHQIMLTGGVDAATLDRLYAQAQIFIMPSLFEGYGMVLAEAMARGLPIVCTTGGAAAETVPDAAAIKVVPGDHLALAAAIDRVLADPALCHRMADASWAAGQHLPRWTDTAAIIAGVLKRVAAGGMT